MTDSIINITKNKILDLDCGAKLQKCEVAYKTYGKLNKNKTNAILVCHALTGDQYCSGIHPLKKKREKFR